MSYKESGISLLDRDKDEEIWQYGQGILFTVTVVTTIGKSSLHDLKWGDYRLTRHYSTSGYCVIPCAV